MQPARFEQASAQNQQLSHWQKFGLATVTQPAEGLRIATDDWPFFYVRKPMMPSLSLRGILIMAGLALLLIFFFSPRRTEGQRAGLRLGSRSLYLQMFFFCARFLLVETKAVGNI